MGAHQIDTGPNESGQAAEPRSFLFLQGPISDFFDRLGRALIARGHQVHRINLHFGDQLFWRLPATHFRGRFDEWRAFIGDILETHAVTDLIVHGDRRPYHLVAAEEARARGVAVIATDLGYIRPDWVTLEYDGLTTYSRFPRDPDEIRKLVIARANTREMGKIAIGQGMRTLRMVALDRVRDGISTLEQVLVLTAAH